MTIRINSKLPHIGTTIFTVMSQLASEHHAVNLGQGYPDFACDPTLIECVNAAMQAGYNQYPPMAGVMDLRTRIAEKTHFLTGADYSPESAITITAGATQAIFTALQAWVKRGDEVIVLTPSYDCYAPAIALAGGNMVCVPLRDDFRPDLPAIAQAVTPRTSMMIINTPHNPTGICWNIEEWQALAALLRDTKVVVLSDEVYEHMVYDGARAISASSLPALRERTMVVSSFGKTFHVTGWKVGYVLAPNELMAEFRKVHQFNVFTVNTPMQYALAEYLRDPEPYLQLASFYQPRRDQLTLGLRKARFTVRPCEGTYFLLAEPPSINALESLSDLAICQWLTVKAGVTAIPLSAFYPPTNPENPPPFCQAPTPAMKATPVLRFCFAKKPETLETAIDQLIAWQHSNGS
jgi:methionine aminotransferase